MNGFSIVIVPPTQPPGQAFSSMNSSPCMFPFSIWSSTLTQFSIPSVARSLSLNIAVDYPPDDAQPTPKAPVSQERSGVPICLSTCRSEKYTSATESTQSTSLL